MVANPIQKASRPASLYDADFHRWTQQQGRALRERHPSDIDWENVAEEIETLGRTEKSEIASRLNVLLLHLLKGQFQSEDGSNSWRGSVVEQRRKLQRLLKENPSLRSYPDEIGAEEYEIARLRAAGETGLPLEHFSEGLPYTIAEILSDSFYPGEEN
jgi:hypothetical protein